MQFFLKKDTHLNMLHFMKSKKRSDQGYVDGAVINFFAKSILKFDEAVLCRLNNRI